MTLFDYKVRHIKILSAIALVAAVTACNTSAVTMSFAKPFLESNIYESDLSSCAKYVDIRNASNSDRAGSIFFSFLLGGSESGLSAVNAYEENNQRVFEECMYIKGYQTLVVPDDYHQINKLYRILPQDMAFELIKANKMTEHLDWNQAIGLLGSKEAIKKYTIKYPQGFFIEEAHTRLNAVKLATP